MGKIEADTSFECLHFHTTIHESEVRRGVRIVLSLTLDQLIIRTPVGEKKVLNVEIDIHEELRKTLAWALAPVCRCSLQTRGVALADGRPQSSRLSCIVKDAPCVSVAQAFLAEILNPILPVLSVGRL